MIADSETGEICNSSPQTNVFGLKVRIWPSLDFTIGNSQPPKKDKKSWQGSKITVYEWWNGYKYDRYTDVELDQKAVNRFLGDKNGVKLTPDEWGELFLAYEDAGQIDKSLQVLSILQTLDAQSRSPLGLSAAANSHSLGSGLNSFDLAKAQNLTRRRLERGQRGISPYGKKMVRSAGVLLEEKYSRQCLTLGTCTLPALEPEEFEVVCKGWSDLTRKFFQELQRLLERRQLATHYVQVTEIQEKRFLSWGQIAPHLHWVVQGRRHRREDWRIKPDEVRSIWERLLGNLLNRAIDGKAATRIEQPRKSLAAELGKYLSKGSKIVQAIQDAGKGAFLPSAWWGVSKFIRIAIKKRIIEAVGNLADWIDKHLDQLRAEKKIAFTRIYRKIEYEGGSKEVCCGIVGRFKSKAILKEVLDVVSDKNLLTA
jgi:hypothetical protein